MTAKREQVIEELMIIKLFADNYARDLMTSSGIRVGAWDYLMWGHITPIKQNGQVVAAKIIVYPGDTEEYFTFITSEAYVELEKWINFRKESGEEINVLISISMAFLHILEKNLDVLLPDNFLVVFLQEYLLQRFLYPENLTFLNHHTHLLS